MWYLEYSLYKFRLLKNKNSYNSKSITLNVPRSEQKNNKEEMFKFAILSLSIFQFVSLYQIFDCTYKNKLFSFKYFDINFLIYISFLKVTMVCHHHYLLKLMDVLELFVQWNVAKIYHIKWLF